ncbi:MAG: hypothetical protein QF704_09470, partial [Anaerolineales bacterium]|nr:hypothetical protein [Anaerolineales bacterium]
MMLTMGVHFFITIPVLDVQAVTGVTIADTDTTGFGLDGRDFKVTWTPGASPAGYSGTQIYIVDNATAGSLNIGNVTSTGCGGGACTRLGEFFDQSFAEFIPPQSVTQDSVGNNWNAGTTYKACVLTNATVATLDCAATGISPTSDIPADAAKPFIGHLPVHTAVAATTAYINAFVRDDQSGAALFVTEQTGAIGPYFRLFYGADVSTSETTVRAGQIDGSLFTFRIPGVAFPAAGGTMEYYLHAEDEAGNETFFC